MKKILAVLVVVLMFFPTFVVGQEETVTVVVTVVSKTSKPIEGLEVRANKPVLTVCKIHRGDCELRLVKFKDTNLRVLYLITTPHVLYLEILR